MSRNKNYLTFLCVASIAILILYFINQKLNSVSIFSSSRLVIPAGRKTVDSKKWIVVTTINYPTEDVKRLAEFTNWTLVVVADTKTPTDWKLDGVHFLSVDEQINMGLKLPSELPFKTYARKTIGYLYAIKNGAEWIYDTDDDNKPFGRGLEQFDYTEKIHGLRYQKNENDTDVSKKLFNPYRFFGIPAMWPRGFPLEYISNHTNGVDRYLLCHEMSVSAVQQGLVHKDPDVDAIYRLLHGDKVSGLNERFNKFAPPVTMDIGTYAPWNSQNTLFNRKAFFTMFLPTTVEFRATDIWRSYFSQKLLHLIGETVSFYPVNAVQYRNAHNYLADFQDEKSVYSKSGAMVRYLDSWTCPSNNLVDCVKNLAIGFRELDFIGEKDVRLIDLWLEDLIAIGYQFPDLQNGTNYIETKSGGGKPNCRLANLDIRNVETIDPAKPDLNLTSHRIELFSDVLEWCAEADAFNLSDSSSLALPPPHQISEIQANIEGLSNKLESMLMITNNYQWKQSIGFLQRMYSPYFAVTIFCGTWNRNEYNDTEKFPPIIEPVNIINLSEEEMHQGYFGYHCLSKARDLNLQNINGIYVISDDTVFNFWVPNSAEMVSSGPLMPWLDPNYWPLEYGKAAAEKVVALVTGKYSNDSRIQRLWTQFDTELKLRIPGTNVIEHMLTYNGRSGSDTYYIPSSKLEYITGLFEIFNEASLFLEIAFSKVLHSIDFDPAQLYEYMWFYDERVLWPEKYNSSLTAMHPVKTSTFQYDLPARKLYCDNIIATFRQELYGT